MSPPTGRLFPAQQQGALGGPRREGEIGMPVSTGVTGIRLLAANQSVGDHQQFRMLRIQVSLGCELCLSRVPNRLAKAMC